MKFGIAFVHCDPFISPDAFGRFVATAEEVGFESIWVPEHVVVPVEYASIYPYHPGGRVAQGVNNAPIPDPLIYLAFAAAITKTLMLGTGILVLPQRHPIYVAKELASLDVLSGGRVICGIGINWMREECEALGLSFEDRAARSHEAVKAIRSLWRDEPEAFDGKFFKWPAVNSNPKPVQKPGVPFVVAGGTGLAARRAARYGDGFFPPVSDPEQLQALLKVMRDECNELGRSADEIELTVGNAMAEPPDVDTLRQLADMGVTRCVIRPPVIGIDKNGVRAGLSDFAERIIAKV